MSKAKSKSLSIMEMIAEAKKKHKDDADRNKAIVLGVLKALQIREVEVDFDGSGDSGQINDVLYVRGVGKKDGESNEELDNTEIEGAEVVHSTEWDGGKEEWVKMKQATLRDLIEELCYDLLEANHGGWEINEGSFGKFRLVVKDDKIDLTFHERIESVETSEETY